MPQRINCPKCQVALNCPENLGGRPLRCERCQHVFNVDARSGKPVEVLTFDEPPAPAYGPHGLQAQPGTVPPPPDELPDPEPPQAIPLPAQPRKMSPALIGGAAAG